MKTRIICIPKKEEFQMYEKLFSVLREEEINPDGNRIVTRKSVLGVVTPETVMVKNDILVLFGRNQDIEAFIEKYVD